MTPAIQAGLTKKSFTIGDIANLVPEPIAAKRGTYKKANLKKSIL